MISRYLRLYLYFLRFSFTRALEFRIDFSFRILMDLLYYGVNIAFYKILYNHTTLLGGFSEEQAMIFVAAYLLVDALHMTLFSSNMWWLPYYINRGELDYYLIRPVAPLFFLSLREFAANSFINLLCAIAIFIWALASYLEPIGSWQLVLFLLLLMNGVALYYFLHLLAILPTFWSHAGRGFEPVVWALEAFMERPDAIFRGWLRTVLTTVLPFSLMVSFPARLFFGELDPLILLQIIGVTISFALFALLLWHWGLRAYSSASS